MRLNHLRRPSSLAENETKPLLVLLHGFGSNKEDLFSFAAEVPEKYEVLSLEAPLQLPYGGFAWYEINFMNGEKYNDEVQANTSKDLIMNDINEYCETWNCEYDRVNICGFSQGGILSYALALNYPSRFSKVLCLSAYPEEKIIGDLHENSYSQLSFFISHGMEDTVIPISWAREGETWMNKLGIAYEYHEYQSGHGINPQNFKDLIAFLSK